MFTRRRCSCCSQTITRTTAQCPHCGHAERFCPYCGEAILKSAKRCPHCNSNLNSIIKPPNLPASEGIRLPARRK